MSAISGITAANPNAVGAAAGAFGDLSSDEFIQIMIQELTNQDPFNPNDSQALLEQLSSLRQIESDLALQQNLQALVQQNALSSASGFLGQLIEGVNETGGTVTGYVQALEVENGQAVLRLDNGARVPSTSVTQVQGSSDLNEQATQLLLSNILALDSGKLVGMRVEGVNDDNQLLNGVVTQVRLDVDETLLTLDNGGTIRASQVDTFLPPN